MQHTPNFGVKNFVINFQEDLSLEKIFSLNLKVLLCFFLHIFIARLLRNPGYAPVVNPSIEQFQDCLKQGNFNFFEGKLYIIFQLKIEGGF